LFEPITDGAKFKFVLFKLPKKPAQYRTWFEENVDKCHNLDAMITLGNPPSCPMQQYIAATLPYLHRKKLNTPAPYLRTCSQIPTLLLLRARCQNLTHLRSNLYDTTDTALPYRGIPCLAALLDQGPLLINKHHTVDNIHHLATSCVTMRDHRKQLGHQLEGIMVELGIQPREWSKVSEENKTFLTLASDPPAEWHLRKKTIIAWRDHAMPYSAAFAIHA